MEKHEYRQMFDKEDTLWWYRGIRLYFERAIKRTDLREDATVLDAGCGTGANLVFLSNLFPRTFGCDLAEEAVALCTNRGLKRVLVADVNRLPFRGDTFDCILSSDVFESSEVDERLAISELARVTRTGGRIILSVAAYQFLISEHDRAVHSVRRYTKSRARRALSASKLEIVGMHYLFGCFFLPIMAYRLLRRLVRSPGTANPPRSDVFHPPSFINRALFGIVRLEAALSRFGHLPFGTTLLVEMRRI